MLRFNNYKKQFGDTLVIGVPQMDLDNGIYWLKGENGSGKTTLIKSICGLIPFDGDITVAGNNIRKDRMAYTAAVNYAEAEPLYPSFLTGNDLIQFYQKTKGGTAQECRRLMEAMGIDSYVAKKVGTYSSGMAKKLSLVLGFLGNPTLILLDEPLITLDQQSVTNLREMIEEYVAKDVSFLVTSHQEVDFNAQLPQRLFIKDKTLVRE